MKKSFPFLAPVVGVMLAVGLAGCGGGSSVTNINISGTITGLTASGLILSNGYTTLTVAANSTSFRFGTRINEGLSYSVQVYQHPDQMTCAVTNGSGTAGNTDITNVQVACAPNKKLGGTVTGLIGTLELVNGNDKATVTSTNGAATGFEFSRRVREGSAYAVTILSKPAAQTCSVTNGVGTIGSSDVTNVQVTCQ